MSPRAAWRLETLGYQHAYDYAAGKADWLAFGLPHEGTAMLASQALSTDMPTCSLHDHLGDVRRGLETSPYGTLVVLNAHGIVIGQLDRQALTHDDNHTAVDQLM